VLALPSTAGRVWAFPIERVELLKWVGLYAMLLDHTARYLISAVPGEAFPSWLGDLGRLAFPCFAIALAVGSDGLVGVRFNGLIRRLVLWGVIAQVAGSFIRVGDYANVLFTLALGLLLYRQLERIGPVWKRAAWSALILLAGTFVEFRHPGVLFVAVCCWWAARPSMARLVAVVAASLLLAGVNGSLWATPAVLAAVWLLEVPWIIPRVRGMFYWVYAAQWPLLIAARWAL
jgi:hypothetical protein